MRELIYAARRRLLPLSWRNQSDAAWAAWRNGLWSYGLYRQTMRDKWLRRSFQELVAMDSIWSGLVSLPGVPHLQLFDAAAAAEDWPAAEKAGSKILRTLRNPIERGFLRLLLAARALQNYNSVSLVDALFTSDSTNLETSLERLLLSTSHGPPDAIDRSVLAQLVVQHKVPKVRAVQAWCRSCWLFQGASERLLEEVLHISEQLSAKEKKALLREALSLALQLDDKSTVRKLLHDWPELKTTFLSVLPLAPYLLSHGIEPTSDRKSIVDYAELYAKLQQDTAALMEIIREKGRSLAIVGNSPCEIGFGQGARIDAHDLVARFNVFSTSEQFAIDYGTKCNIHVRSLPEDENANELSAVSDTVVLSRADLIYRNRDWKNVLQLAHSGAKLATFPAGFHQRLYKALGGAPSSGIAFCALAKQERGILLRSSCFGFAFIDQIGPKPSSAHYFRDARPSFKHQWKRERELFDKLTAISPGADDESATATEYRP